jgi:chemotaxis protein methyltransferase CheR
MKGFKTEAELLIEAIGANSSYDFNQYSEKSFQRRVEKILSDYKLNMNELVIKLSENPDFLEEVVRNITVNTTEIFRDTVTWQILKHKVLKKYYDKPEINIWHIGCSTGQEVYSTLILLNELNLLSKSNVLATDLNTDVLDIAEKGIYKFREIDEFIEGYNKVMCENPFNDETHIDVQHDKYFIVNRKKNMISVKPVLLNKIIFSKHDIVNQGNIFDKTFDIIFCRNVLIYFNHDFQNQLFDFFYKNLNPEGILIIGRHEGMLGEIATKFKKEESIYTKRYI